MRAGEIVVEESTNRSVAINASPEKIWRALTDVVLMPKWMSETEMKVETDWSIGSSIIIQGRWHKMRYRNIGTVLQFDHARTLSYSHLSSLSRLADLPENHSIITFQLTKNSDQTLVDLTLSNSPTYEIQKHLEFYWNVTLDILKAFVEQELRD